MWVVMLQSQAIRLAVSRAMWPAPFTVARLEGMPISSSAGAAPDASFPDIHIP